MNKLVKTAKTLDCFFRIFKILVVIIGSFIVMAVALVGAVQMLAPETLPLTGDVLFLGPVELTLAPGIGEQSYLSVLMAVGAVLVSVVMLLVFIHYFRQMLAPMTQGKPFSDIVGRSLKKLAWVEIALGILYNVLTLGEAVVINRLYPLAELFSETTVIDISGYYELDLSFLVNAAVFFLLSYIFSYGAQLQQLSDETL